MKRCRDVTRALSEARDSGRKLTAVERLHLMLCVVCRRWRRQLDWLGAAASRAPSSGPSLSDGTKERLRRLLK